MLGNTIKRSMKQEMERKKKKSRIIALKIQERNGCTLSKLSLNKVVSYVLTFHDNTTYIIIGLKISNMKI